MITITGVDSETNIRYLSALIIIIFEEQNLLKWHLNI